MDNARVILIGNVHYVNRVDQGRRFNSNHESRLFLDNLYGMFMRPDIENVTDGYMLLEGRFGSNDNSGEL